MEIDTKALFDKYLKENLKEMPKENTKIKEEDILAICSKDFEYQIKSRGKEYYEWGNIVNLYKSNNKYFGKVEGNEDDPYDVTVEIDEKVTYTCSCPYQFPCKHEYAVLMAIHNQEYEEINLKEEKKKSDINLKEILTQIPSEELKKYLLTKVESNYIDLSMTDFANYFIKYYPQEKYEYYYNNLYNALVLDNDSKYLVDKYLKLIKQYISSKTFLNAFEIIKAIINAYHDTETLNLDEFIMDHLPLIGMYLRIIYRKCDNSLKKEIDKWILELIKENYYDNYYLEDIILSIK